MMCKECENYPCICGDAYKDLELEFRVQIAAAVLGIPIHAISETLNGLIPTTHPLGEY